MEQVILVNDNDEQVGVCEKMEAHQKGLLHRAFSVFIFNDKHEWLLQKRADTKYHSAGLWSNTCCSHPKPSETIETAALRRLNEEAGLHANLEKVFKFQYKHEFDNALIEHELDHVFIGKTNRLPILNPDEASDWKYISTENLLLDIDSNPDLYTYWFKLIVKRVIDEMLS